MNPRNLLVALASLIVPATSFAVPTIASSSVTVTTDNLPVITITGADFGSKVQASPILIDRAEKAIESGVDNPLHAAVEHAEQPPDIEESSSAVWAVVRRLFITSKKQPRHRHSEEHYIFQGPNERVGNPTAYGGVTGWETPPDNDQLYVSWWFKPMYSPSRYWRFASADQNGDFQPGETLNFEGGRKATFIGKDGEGKMNIVFQVSNPSSASVEGQKMTGEESKASATFPDVTLGNSTYGYETPGSQKYIRIWEHPQGEQGIRFSWTQMHQTIFKRDGSGKSLTNWDSKDLEGGQWHHLELAMDVAKGKVDLFINSEHLTEFNFSPDIEMPDASPTIALLGLNGKVGALQVGEVDDIYMDSTVQRVVLADAANIEGVTHWEVQEPIEWTATRIKFKVFEGALPDFKSSYIYVFDENGNVNSSGIPVCDTCKAPPVKVEVLLED